MTVDALGRKDARPMGWELLLEAIPGLARRFKPIPDDYFYTGGSGGLVVNCVCGFHPFLDGSWDTYQCGCGRYFISVGGKVFCALKSEAETAEPPAGVSAGRS